MAIQPPDKVKYSDTLRVSTDKINVSMDIMVQIANAIDNDPEFARTIDGLLAYKETIEGARIKDEAILQEAVAYTDDQIQLVTATGIPKLVSYQYPVPATREGQTDFLLVNETFNPQTDTLIVIKNSIFLDKTKYTVVHNTTQNRYVIRLNQGATLPTNMVLMILKNVPIGPEGAINGGSLAVGSIPLNRLSTEVPTKAEVNAQFTKLVGATPEALDTLNELAIALGNDPNFATTITNLITTKTQEAKDYARQLLTSYGYGSVAKDITGSDLNNLTANGVFMGNNLINGYTTDWFIIENFRHNALYGKQIAHLFTHAHNTTVMRSQNAGTWGAWVEVLTRNHINTPYGVAGLDGQGRLVDSSGSKMGLKHKTYFYTASAWLGPAAYSDVPSKAIHTFRIPSEFREISRIKLSRTGASLELSTSSGLWELDIFLDTPTTGTVIYERQKGVNSYSSLSIEKAKGVYNMVDESMGTYPVSGVDLTRNSPIMPFASTINYHEEAVAIGVTADRRILTVLSNNWGTQNGFPPGGRLCSTDIMVEVWGY